MKIDIYYDDMSKSLCHIENMVNTHHDIALLNPFTKCATVWCNGRYYICGTEQTCFVVFCLRVSRKF